MEISILILNGEGIAQKSMVFIGMKLQMVISSYGIIRILIVKEIGAIGRIWLSLLFSYGETVL